MTELLTPLHIIFYGFAALAVCSALAVITVRNPVSSVLSLVITFFAMGSMWMMLRAEFLALILLLVYVGAVMTLFLFVVMMLNIDTESKQSGYVRYWPVGLLLVIVMTGIIICAVGPQYFGLMQMPAPAAESADFSNLHEIGISLFTQYAYPFEVAGVSLLAAMIAAISLTYRGPLRRKQQNIDKQVAVRPEDRLRLIKMPSEPKQKGS